MKVKDFVSTFNFNSLPCKDVYVRAVRQQSKSHYLDLAFSENCTDDFMADNLKTFCRYFTDEDVVKEWKLEIGNNQITVIIEL